MQRILRKLIPLRLREARFKQQRLGSAKSARYRRLVRVERRKPPPRAGEPFDIGGAAFVLHASTLHSVRSHWIDYGHGIEELHAFKRLASGHVLLLDIGAAEGIFSAAFCALTGQRAWAFEPSPEMLTRLEHVRRLNPTLAIHISDLALGAKAEQRPVRQYTDGQFSAAGAQAGGSDTMGVTTLDAVVEQHGLKPDLAKIDVEGMELDVLRGGECTFRSLVRTIVLEVHYTLLAQLGQTMPALQALLEDYGYGLESLDGGAIDDLAQYARAQPEMLPGYTIVVCRRPHV
jgi:FkbM family methyltransferase